MLAAATDKGLSSKAGAPAALIEWGGAAAVGERGGDVMSLYVRRQKRGDNRSQAQEFRVDCHLCGKRY